MNRVVITGAGIYSSIGKNLDEVKDSLWNGRSGIVIDDERKKIGYQSALTGKLETPDLKGILDHRARACMPQQAAFAYLATAEALKTAAITPEYLEQNSAGILYGSDSSALPVIEAVDIIRETGDTGMLSSGSLFQSMNSIVTMNLSVIFRLNGINFTVSGACASGAHAIGMGFLMIRHGYQNIIICGGSQEVNLYCVGNFDALGAFSKLESEPEKACRPFDRKRDGLVPSGGAATVVLQEMGQALRRGAPIIGEIIGYGFSSDGSHVSVPEVKGQVRAINMALSEAGISPRQVDYINAHATSTVVGDQVEAKSVNQIFMHCKPPVTSTKSMTGHELSMGGASEIVYSLIMMQNSFIAPNINFEEPDEITSRLNIISRTTSCEINTFLSNSFGFGGTNSCLIIRKPG